MAVTPALAERLDEYAIGRKIRDLRIKKKLGLVELGQHTGLSAALLSKVERGKMYPTLPTLLRIALVFGVGLDHFFRQDTPVLAVLRRHERESASGYPTTPPGSLHPESFTFPTEHQRLRVCLASFRPSAVDDIKLHRHQGVEFIYVVDGTLGLYSQDAETTLETGDSVYFDPSQPHGYRRVGRRSCRALIVVLPATDQGT